MKKTMAAETKMIIITSNEDFIRRLDVIKTKNTQIIDLDNAKEVTLTANDNNNIINLGFLAELSELNSKSDPIYKRALDSPHHNRSKQVKLSKKSVGLICAICGGEAYGFNYDVVSCPSCKAFFRRNANQPPTKINCLTGQGRCSVTHQTQRKCPRCRLDRCFAVGMRKDYFVTAEEKERRKQRLQENRNRVSKRSSTSESTNSTQPLTDILDEVDHLIMDLNKDDDNIVLDESIDLNEMEDISFGTLSLEDWITIENVRSSFLSVFQNDIPLRFYADMSDRDTALISWSQFANKISLRFINYFRHMDEFENLNADDRFILVKYNLLPLYPLMKCFNDKRIDDSCLCDDNGEAERHRQFFILCGDSYGIRDIFFNLVLSLVEITEQDSTVLSLLTMIWIFTHGLSMNDDEATLKDALAVQRAQSYYTKLLWNYWVNKHGEIQACKYFTQLLTILFRIQSGSKIFRDFFRTQFLTSNTVDRMAPLMQSVLHIS